MPRDQVRATPRSAPLGALADFLAKSYSPERTQQMQGMAKFLDIPAISETLNRLSYGEPLTTGAGGLGGTTRFLPEVLDAAMVVAPGAGALGRLAAQGTMATGRAGARLAERVVPRIMERGGTGAEMLQGMSRGTVSPMQIFDTTGLPKKGVKLGNKVLPVIMHPIEAREGNVLANVNPQAFDKAFKKTEWQYVGPQGQGGIGDRYNKFGEFAQTAPSMNASNVSVDKIGRITFGDGRHRYAYLRDQGVDSIPMSMDKESLANAKLHGLLNYGVQGPQSEALRLAQQRAALPPSKGGLGLPANNTAQQRARAMNFEERGFHETEGANIESGLTNFDVRRAGAAASDEQTPYAMFIKPNPSGIGIARNNPAQMPLMVKSNLTDENILKSFSNREELQRYLDQFPEIKKSTRAVSDLDNQMANYMDELSNKMDKLYAEGKTEEADKIYNLLGVDSPLMKEFDARINELSANSKEQITDLFKSQGVGTVGLQNDAGAFGRKTITEMVLDPNENVRSRFAAFDPFRRTAAIAATMGVAAPDLMAKEMDEEIPNQPPEYQSGGVVKLLQNMLVKSGEKALTAAQRAEAGRAAAALIKSQEQVKASEALGQQMEKGMKRTTTTQADRTRVGGGNIGGAPFPALSQADPAYKGKVWGVMDEGTASRLKNLTTPETAWTTMLGSATQLKTNPVVFDKLKRQFLESMKQGNLSDELAEKINQNLSIKFGEGADIRDPGIWKLADTFDKRAALADAMMGQGVDPSKGGIALGGEKSGRGVIFRPTDTLIKETEPYLLPSEFGGDVPTFAAGPRLFSLEKESMYRPDLHPGFPTIIKGEDLGVNMAPTPTEVYLPDWHAKFKKDNPKRQAPGYYDLALGVKGEGLPSQDLNDEYIRHLLREGFAEGGAVHMDEGGAAFGVFPQMKARRAKQDREAAANAPLSALRGWLAGTAGLPGDIEGLARAGISQLPPQLLTAFPALRAFGIGSRANPTPQLPTTEFYNEYLPGAQLNQTPTGKAFTTAGNVLGGTGATAIAGLGAKSTAELANLAARIAAESPRAGSRAAQLGVIKMPNGNFLTGRTEKDLAPLKARGPTHRDEALLMGGRFAQMADDPESIRIMAQDAALNKWVDSNLTNYVKKQMGTPDDPVRKLAEEGISHKPTILEDLYDHPATSKKLKNERIKAGFPEAGMGNSPTARAWERVSDKAIATHRAGDIQNMPEQYAKFQEAERKVRAARQAVERKFRQQMQNVGIEDPNMGMHFSTSLDEKAKIVGDTDLAKANAEYKSLQSPMMESYIRLGKENPWISKVNPETPVYTPFTGDLGFDHIMDVLREDVTAGRIRPDQLNKVSMEQAVRRTYEYDQELAAKMNASRAAAREGLPTYREYPEGYKWIQLNKPGSFAQESEAMGHSVRGYEPPKGHPDWSEGSGEQGSSGYGHGGWEAIKSGKAKVYSLVDSKGAPHATVEVGASKTLTPEKRAAQMESLMHRLRGEGMSEEAAMRQAEKLYPESETLSRITQIKGKQNRAPNEEYLPFVQDFVKSGNWSDVGDLQNTGLVKHNGKIMTQGEADDLILKELNEAMPGITDDLGLTTPPEGFAHGGLVSNHFDPIKIKQIIASLDDDYDPQRIQQIIAHQESSYA
jgi:hypothetical protein